jgi:XTP/dITP diphosphohydrolase
MTMPEMGERMHAPPIEKLVIASHNKGKVSELEELLEPLGITVVAAAAMGLPEPEENGASFAENAAIKANAAAKASGIPALADDSGLSVRALDGAPGIRSARWAGSDRDFTLAMERVHEALVGNEDLGAEFVCDLCLAWPNGEMRHFEGRVAGTIVWPPRGEKGFGYDPIFQPAGWNMTFGEMEPRVKHTISHRARAFNQLIAALSEAP